MQLISLKISSDSELGLFQEIKFIYLMYPSWIIYLVFNEAWHLP